PTASAQPIGAAQVEDIGVWLDRYGRMLVIRHFESEMQHLFLRGEVHGTTHLSSGQEAVPVGVCSALKPEDWITGTYRGHGHALAKGTEPEALAAEMLGRATGVCGGRAGSMNVVDLEHGLVGCFGIVGGSIAAATGAALTGKRQRRVSVAFFGDGAANQAYFHECLNFARVFELPAVYVCENNLYGEFTPMKQVTAGGEIAARAGAYGIPFSVVDGNDLEAVADAAVEAVGRARRNGGPTLLECRTYRHFGHSKSDPARYRPTDEVERWLERDPPTIARAGLRPVIEIMFGDFMGLAMDSLVNQAAKLWYVSNEQGSAPLVVRSAVGAGGRFGAMHSQIHGTWFQGIPGLKVVAPSSPADAKGLLKSAIRDDNPVIFLEHKRLYSVKGPEPTEETIPIGQATVAREGDDLTIVSVSKGVRDAREAAEPLAGDGLDAAVVDLRTLPPLDV